MEKGDGRPSSISKEQVRGVIFDVLITRALYTNYLTARESCLVCCLNDLTIIGLELIDLSTIREQFNSKIKVFF